ncbi:S-layer homology domain-containing protein [Aneurinibacillus sp. Ricciae_BoGa-3]|nr:S-layer homology domain-containing protein [Aneurinibacillus sp. Ricciae_BoGa-3]WCK56904.1 S-layer homology domain-containing protein [Aneurinibacillus sp. Ricciae_BoGa-3]
MKLSPVSEDKLSSFVDASSIAPWGKEFVGEVMGQGIMHGYPDKTFKPNNNITRAESVFTLDEALNSQSTDNGNTSTTGDSISTTTPSTGSTGGGGGSSSGGSTSGSSSSGSLILNNSSSSTITYNSGSINRTSFAGITTVQITGPVSFGSTSLIPSNVTVVIRKGASLTGPGTIAGTLNMVDDPTTSLNNVTVTGQTNIIAQ